MRRLTNWLKTNSLEGQNILENTDISSLQNKVDSLPPYFFKPLFRASNFNVSSGVASLSSTQFYSSAVTSVSSSIYGGSRFRITIPNYMPSNVNIFPFFFVPHITVGGVLYHASVVISSEIMDPSTFIDIYFKNSAGNTLNLTSNNFSANLNLYVFEIT